MGAYDPRVARQGQTQVNLPNGFAPAPAAAVNGFAQQGPAPMPPQPNPMRQAVPQPGIPQGPMPGQGQPAPNPMLAGADMQQPGMPSMIDRLMSPAGQIGMGLMAGSGPSLQPVNPMKGAMTGLNNAMQYQRQKEADAAEAAYKQQALDIQRAKLGQGTALQRDYEYLKKNGYSDEEAMAILKKGTTIDMGTGADTDKLREKLSGKEGEQWASYLGAGATAASQRDDFMIMEELLTIAPQGPITGRLAEFFPGFDSAGAALASMAGRIAPTLRVEGSGSTSDIEFEGMLNSLPRLRNYPEANRLILQTMKAKAQINIDRANVIRQYQNQKISDVQAREQLAEIESRSILDPKMTALLAGVGAFEDDGNDVNASAIQGAQDAIAAGADPEKVRQRLIESGVSIPEGMF